VRASFDNMANVYTGPNGTPAGTYQFTTSCRLVANLHYTEQQSQVGVFSHYVNWEGPPTYAGEYQGSTGVVTVDLDSVDQWEIPAGSGIWYAVLWASVVIPGDATNPPYRRANLILLP